MRQYLADFFWRNQKGELHREDGPAIEVLDGKSWYLNGQCHRVNGPACEYANGDKSWWLNGQRHREDGPAIEFVNGHKEWYLNGQRHRVNGPAVERANGDKQRWLNGLLHREDGPAIEYANGNKEWWLNGEQLSEKEFNIAINNKKENRLHCVEDNGSVKTLSQYRSLLQDNGFENYAFVIKELFDFSIKLSTELVVHDNVKSFFKLAPNQFNIGLKTNSFSKTLVKAYVDKEGFPVVLIFAGKRVAVSNKEELLHNLYEVIPPEILPQLRAIFATVI